MHIWAYLADMSSGNFHCVSEGAQTVLERRDPFVDPFRQQGEDPCRLFALDGSYTFLNHGSFGATPIMVMAHQTRLRAEIEARPIEMLARRLGPMLRAAASEVARFVGTDPSRLGFITNATEAINAVLRSMQWHAGDEILVVDHVYNAIRQSIRRLSSQFGVVLREVDVALPVTCATQWVEAVDAAITPRTRLIVIDHVTSATALVIPVTQIVKLARARGVRVIVDGAHAPGSIELHVDEIGADAYAANLHKWCCAPKGSAFLAVREDFVHDVHPLVTSHDFERSFASEFDWQGTRDPTAWLASPTAIELFARFGWDAVRSRNHAMATWTQQELCQRWAVQPLSPLDGSMLASMTAVRIPKAVQRRFETPESLQAALYSRRIEVPVIDWKGDWHVRVSCHLHTTADGVTRLADELLALVV
jgi:isopenicillin-N epimerase